MNEFQAEGAEEGGLKMVYLRNTKHCLQFLYIFCSG